MAPRCFLPEGVAWGQPSPPSTCAWTFGRLWLSSGKTDVRSESGLSCWAGPGAALPPWASQAGAAFILRALHPAPASPALLSLLTLTGSSVLVDLTLEPNFYVTAMPLEDRRDGDKGF